LPRRLGDGSYHLTREPDMAVAELSPETTTPSATKDWYARAYRLFGYFGMLSISGALIYGFRYDYAASTVNYLYNFALYAAFMLPHLVMTRGWFKRIFTGSPAGSPRERRVYVTITILSWFAVLILARPLPGLGFTPAADAATATLAIKSAMAFIGTIVFLMGMVMMFEGATTATVDGLLGVPGAVKAYSHGADTALFTEGQYAQVRHPMYRAAIIAAAGTLLVHPNAAQLFWAVLIEGTLIAFIPVEEAQLLAARGDDYRRYRERTPYRLFRGVW
jgi:protein-S-isoprenylcysteine O-methyltransferase Ste14